MISVFGSSTPDLPLQLVRFIFFLPFLLERGSHHLPSLTSSFFLLDRAAARFPAKLYILSTCAHDDISVRFFYSCNLPLQLVRLIFFFFFFLLERDNTLLPAATLPPAVLSLLEQQAQQLFFFVPLDPNPFFFFFLLEQQHISAGPAKIILVIALFLPSFAAAPYLKLQAIVLSS